MAVTIIRRPEGRIIDTASNTGTASDSSGNVSINSTGHGLNTGDSVYIYSAFSSYNGVRKINKTDADNFKFYTNDDQGTFQPFVNSGTITFYKTVSSHKWNCVHLPIIYKLNSTIWPTNNLDTTVSVSSQTNYGNYTKLTLSGDGRSSGTIFAYDSIILSGTPSLDGIYKVIKRFSDTSIVIDLIYSDSNIVTGSLTYYYFNYNIRVKIYAGISSSHTWGAQKPYVELVELKLIPDSNGNVEINIADYIKSKINVTTNNTILDTLPNNIDAWCNFYISYAESYDDSNGYIVDEYISSYTDDSSTFEGFACNSMLPFKNIFSGFMSDYISGLTSNTKQKWLTSFPNPVLFPGFYFDISFIKNDANSGDYILREVYVNGTLKQQYNDTITNYKQGIYRYEIIQSGWSEDRIDITYYNSSNIALSETLTINVSQDCANQNFYITWLNYLGGFDYWNFTARKDYQIDVSESKTQSQNINIDWPKSYGEFADSIEKQTSRTSKNKQSIKSQLITVDQQDAIKLLVSSPLVQIVNSKYDRRTILVDKGSLQIRKDQDKTRKLSFNISYTDNIPSQSI